MPHFSFGAGLKPVIAHKGLGTVLAERVRDRIVGSPINFVDLVVVPPGTSIGPHRHAETDEELYVVIAGTGIMLIDGTERIVAPGDVLLNPPGGTHGLVNSSADTISLVVIDVSTDSSPYREPVNLAVDDR